MSDFYSLYDYCKRTTENNNIKKQALAKNKKNLQKNNLFKLITDDSHNIIKNRSAIKFCADCRDRLFL